MAIIFNDTFTEGSITELSLHTPDTGISWTKIIARLDGDEELRVNTNGTASRNIGFSNDGVLYTADATYSTADYSVETEVAVIDTGDDWAMIAARVQSSTHMYILQYTSTTLELYSKTAASPSGTLIDSATMTISNGDIVKLEVIGSAIKGYVNDIEIVSGTNTDHAAAGKAGIGMGSIVDSVGDMSNQAWAEFTVSDTAATGTNMQLNIGDVWKEVPAVQINIGDVWKEVVSIKQNIGDVWKEVF